MALPPTHLQWTPSARTTFWSQRARSLISSIKCLGYTIDLNPVARRAYPSRGGPIRPEVGLFVQRLAALTRAGTPRTPDCPFLSEAGPSQCLPFLSRGGPHTMYLLSFLASPASLSSAFKKITLPVFTVKDQAIHHSTRSRFVPSYQTKISLNLVR